MLGWENKLSVTCIISEIFDLWSKDKEEGFIMEFIISDWMPLLLLIGGGSLTLSLILLLVTNSYTKKKIKEMEHEETSI